MSTKEQIKKKLQVLSTEFNRTQLSLDNLAIDLEEIKALKLSIERRVIIDDILKDLS